MSTPFKVYSNSVTSHLSAEWPCIASFASEGDARAFAVDVATRPASDGVRIVKRDRVIWEDVRSARHRANATGY